MESNLSKIKHKVLNTAILFGMLFSYPVVTSSISRVFDIGWHNIFFYHIGIAIALTALYLGRNKLTLKFKIHFYVAIFGSINLVGLITFGLVSGISYLFLTVLVITIILDKRTGIIYAVVFILLCSIISIYVIYFKQPISINLNFYNTMPSAWIMTIMGMAYVMLIIITTIGEYNKFFLNNINALNSNIEELNTTQHDLRLAKDAAEERELQLKQISDNFENGMIYQIATVDEDSRQFTYLSESVQKFYGCSVSEAKINPSLIYDRIFEEDKVLLHQLEKKSIQNMEVFKAEVRSNKPDGSLRWVYLVSKPRQVNGIIIWDGVEFDITDLKKTQEEIEVFKKYLDLAPIGAFWNNREGDFIYVNETGCRMLGYSQDELHKKKIYDVNVTITPEKWESVWNEIKNGEIFASETLHRHNDGSLIPTETLSSYLIHEGNEYCCGFAKDITDRKQFEQQMLNSVIETEERERMNFSQELHDGLGPLISAIKMYIQLLTLPGSEVKPDSVIGDMERLIEESSRTIREISFKLSPHILQNYGVIEALTAFIEKVKESKKIEIIFYHAHIGRLSPLIETVIYRVLCECINNTVKHANADRIEINMDYSDSVLDVQFFDNGEGFDVEEVMNSRKGIGLLNIQSRLKSINGSMAIKSSKAGTNIILSIKLANS